MFDWLSTKIDNVWIAFKAFFIALWDDFVNFITDLPVTILEMILNAISSLFSSLPVPSFLESGLSVLFDNLDSSILYFLSQAGISQGFSIYGSGVAFRMLRKIFTFGQW